MPPTQANRGTDIDSDAGENGAPIQEQAINAIRFLAIDMVEKARSGHPGAPMGMAAMAYTLWTRHLRFNPADPAWPDRDRFVLSAGHASALLYGLLHLFGYDLPREELERFRQFGSRTPGHPEHGLTPGVETTTGPLGQGFANAVGMAMAEAALAARYNDGSLQVVDHHTYVICSDGDLMEGVSAEAASLAGTQKLGKLICLYDDNGITIDGSTDHAFTENVGERFAAYGWHVEGPVDGNDVNAVDAAITRAKAVTDRPSLIMTRTHIGYGSPAKQDSPASHGSPLGEDEVAATRANLGWTHGPFEVPDDVQAHFREVRSRGSRLQGEWQEQLDALGVSDPSRAQAFRVAISGELPDGWQSVLDTVFPDVDPSPMATRSASGQVLNALAPEIPELTGGSADLAGSTNTLIKDGGIFSPEDRLGRNIYFGVREHAMGSIASGMALHGGVVPYTGTFLVFADYMRPAIRLAALMKQRVVYIFTHDSIGVGEDGPTHQPVEHLAALRAVPNLNVVRPSDPTEVVEAWRAALLNAGPTALILTRQKVPFIDRTENAPASGLHRGAYVLRDPDTMPEIDLIASGSEVNLVMEAARVLRDKGVAARIISMPCWERFREQPRGYQAEVLLPSVHQRLAVEAGISLGWSEWVGPEGDTLTLDRFGTSAPGGEAFEQLGFTVDEVVHRALALLAREG